MRRGYVLQISFLLVSFRTLAPTVFAQCSIRTELLDSGPVSASIVAPRSWGVALVLLGGLCPGNANASVKFKFTGTLPSTSGLVVSPSSGTTPATVYVAVDLNSLTDAYPGGPSPVTVQFSTVDQSPTSTTSTIVHESLLAPQPPVIQSVVNAASLTSTISPGGLVSILGMSLGLEATPTYDPNGVYPFILAKSMVTFNGVPGAIIAMSAGKILAQAPFEIAGQNTVQVVLTRYSGTAAQQVSNALAVAEADVCLALFPISPAEGVQLGIQNCTAAGCTPNSLEDPAPAGSIVAFYATSAGILTDPMPDGGIGLLVQHNSSATLTIGGQAARILYAGPAPLRPWGILQINAIVPNGLASGPQPVVLTIGNLSNAGQSTSLIVQ
jgi:uncharacterized protein (TIGR03437 family)